MTEETNTAVNKVVEFLTDIQKLKEVKPLVQEIVMELRSYGPDAYALCEQACKGLVDLQAMCIHRLQEEHGFSKEEAIQLTVSNWNSLKNGLNMK